MIELLYYQCEGCNTIHADDEDIIKCKICGADICEHCKCDDDTCFDFCEAKESEASEDD